MPEDERIIRERERLRLERASLRQERIKLRRWWQNAKQQFTPEVSATNRTGFPAKTIGYILWNMLFWDIGITLLALFSTGDIIQAAQVFLGLTTLLGFIFLLQILYWRLYWLFVAIQWTCINVLLLLAILALVSGSFTTSTLLRLFSPY